MAQMQQQESRGEKATRTGEQKGQEAQGGQQSSQALARGSGTTGGVMQRGRRDMVSPSSLFEPFSLMRRFMSDIDRMFDEYGMGSRMMAPSGLEEPLRGMGNRLFSPAIEMFQRGDKLVVRADLPGMTKDNVNVEVEGNMLMISGERRDEREDKREGYYHSERSYGSFSRSIQLPDAVEPSAVEAVFENGVLEVGMNAPKPTGRRIEVKAGGASMQGQAGGMSTQGQAGGASMQGQMGGQQRSGGDGGSGGRVS